MQFENLDLFNEPILNKNPWDKSVKVEENLYYWNKEPIYNKKLTIKTNKPVCVELFCGCGGTSVGFEMAGFQPILGLDIHAPSIETYKNNHSSCSTILGDIRKVKTEKFLDIIGNTKIDILIGGVPCQGFSLNNRKRHENDERNFLYKEFIKFAKLLKPKAILLENVSGMKSSANGHFVKSIENELSDALNMSVSSCLLNAQDYGVPQRRQRLVFIGIEGSLFDFTKIIKTHGPNTKNNYVTIYDAIGDLPSLNSNESAEHYKCEPFSDYQKIMRSKASKTLYNHVAPSHPQSTIDKIKNTIPGKPLYPKFKQRIRLKWDELSPTQVSGGIRPQFQFGHPEDDRGLTIRERCRIQSFPDHYIIHGGIVQGRVQTGNAVPPLLAKAIAKAIKEYL